MLRFISWSDFILVTAFCCISYWIVILFVYYRKDVRASLRSREYHKLNSFEQPISSEEDFFEECSHCAMTIKTIIRGSSLKLTSKESLLSEITRALTNHTNFHNTVWEIPINNLIKFETEQHCSIMLDDQEVKSVWRH